MAGIQLERAVNAYHAGSKPSRYVVLRRYLRWQWLAETIAAQQKAEGSHRDTWQGNYQAQSTDWLVANGYQHLLSTRLHKMPNPYWRERANKQGKDDIRQLINDGYVVRVKAAGRHSKTGRVEHQAVWQLGSRWYLRPTELIEGSTLLRDKIVPYETAPNKSIEAVLWLERLWLWMAARASYDKDRRAKVWKGRAIDLPVCASVEVLAAYHHQATETDGRKPAKILSTGSTSRRLWTLHEMGCITYLPSQDKGNGRQGGKPSIVVLIRRPSEYVADVEARDMHLYGVLAETQPAYTEALKNPRIAADSRAA